MSDPMQSEFVSLEQLVLQDHNYRKFLAAIDFEKLCKPLKKIDNHGSAGANGFGTLTLFKCLLLQFMEDISDRELERFVQENLAARYFCGFGITENTPDHTSFSKARQRIGTQRLSLLFKRMRDVLKQQGLMSEIFTFIDASHLVAKAALWEERDQAIQAGHERFTNEVVHRFAADSQARFGSKGKNTFWFGYKKHVSVDMGSGFINKIAITPANVSDAQGAQHVCPTQGAVYMDKGYCTKEVQRLMAARGCHERAIRKRNMKDKNRDRDRWISRLRSPYEGVFSQQRRRVRYRGVMKNQWSAFMEGLCYNMKRLIVMEKQLSW